MSEEVTNTLPQGNEDYEARVRALEGEKRAIIKDLQGQREKTNSYVRELEEIKANLARQEAPPEETNAEVNRLAQDPRKYIMEAVKPLLDSERKERDFEKSYEWAAKQLEKDYDDVRYGQDHNEFVRIAKENAIDVMADPRKGMKSVLKIYRQEQKEREVQEQSREEVIQNQSTERVTTPRQGQRRWTPQLIAGLSDADYLSNAAEIEEYQRSLLVK